MVVNNIVIKEHNLTLVQLVLEPGPAQNVFVQPTLHSWFVN